MPTADGRRLCMLYLGPIGDGLKWLLPLSDDFAQRYLLVPWVPPGTARITELNRLADAWPDADDVVISHDPDAMQLSAAARESHADFLHTLLPECRRITLPCPDFAVLWPFHAEDPRNTDSDRATDRHGLLPTYPFGDSFVLEMLGKGMPVEEVIAQYLALEVPGIINLDQLLTDSLARLSNNERHADIKVSSYVGDTFRCTKTFSTLSHPSNALLLHICNQILEQINLRAISTQILQSLRPLLKVEVPIHPSIGRYFGLDYATLNMRYTVDRRQLGLGHWYERRLTFAEYVRNYAYFE